MKAVKSKQVRGVYTDVEQLLNCRQMAKGLVLAARKDSRALTDGDVKARYRGRGMEFAEVRPYQPGDDIRTIDWRVTARVQSPYTKLFQEEHERPVFLMVDQRSPMFFGARHFKSVFAAEFAATVAWIAQNNNDRIGALLFGDHDQHDIRPRRGRHAVLELVNQLTRFNCALQSPLAQAGGNRLPEMLSDVARVAKPGALVILVSDFHDFDSACAEPLTLLAKRSDLLAVHVYDPLEQALPATGKLPVGNGQTQMTVDTRRVGRAFTSAFQQHVLALREALQNVGIQYVHAPIDQRLDDFVRDLFHRRHGAAHRRAR